MNVQPGRFSEALCAAMRVMVGALFACHGAQKLFGVLGGKVMTGSSLMVAAGIIEFFGGILIAIGLLTRVAAFLASGEMAVGYFMNHAPNGFWPIQNKGEMAVVYCFVFLFIASFGSRSFSLDRALRRSLAKEGNDCSSRPVASGSPRAALRRESGKAVARLVYRGDSTRTATLL